MVVLSAVQHVYSMKWHTINNMTYSLTAQYGIYVFALVCIHAFMYTSMLYGYLMAPVGTYDMPLLKQVYEQKKVVASDSVFPFLRDRQCELCNRPVQ